MSERQQQLARVILQDPDVASLSSFIGVDGTNPTINTGRIQINLKPRTSATQPPATLFAVWLRNWDRCKGSRSTCSRCRT